MKYKTKYLIYLTMVCLMFSMGCSEKKDKVKDLVALNFKNIATEPTTDPDKTLLIGEWSIIGFPWLIKITDVLDAGKLEVNIYNTYSPTKIEIEMANWAKTGNLLSIYIEIKDPEYPGFHFKLNYIPERDVLVGTTFDPLRNISYPVEFIRER